MSATHEGTSHIGGEGVPLPSNRSFGLVFTVFFALVGCWPLLKGGGVYGWALIASGVMAALALVAPGVLTVPNRLWMKFGELLHRIVSPIVLGVMFFGVITPMGVVARLLGKDMLGLKIERGAKSYWVWRKPPGPDPKDMPNQF